MAKNETPLEINEQATVVHFLREHGIKLFTATAQSTFTGPAGINRNIKAGVQKGIPDLVICLPADKTRNGTPILVFIEMKRVKGSNTSPEQKEWVEFLNTLGVDVRAIIAQGAARAIGYLKCLLKDPEPVPDNVEWDDIKHL